MAAIYRRQQDRGVKRSCWYIGYTDHLGRRRTKKGFSDRGETERLAAKLEHDVMLRKRGLVDPEQEAARERRNALLSEHLAAFAKSQQKNSGKYAKLLVMRIRTLLEAAGVATAGEITIEAVENALVTLKKATGFGHRTYNHYVQAVDSFCNWLVMTKRLASNPLVGLERLNAEVDIRHRRRALTEQEIGQLVESARYSRKRIQGYSSKLRARLYLTAYFTGLRRSELGSFRPTVSSLMARRRRYVSKPLIQSIAAKTRCRFTRTWCATRRNGSWDCRRRPNCSLNWRKRKRGSW